MSEMHQRSFNGDEIPTIVNASEPHMACLLLIDTSGSMDGSPMEELNNGLNQFKEEVCKDKTTRDVLDVAIVTFSDEVKSVQEFVPIEYMKPVNLTACGGTYYAPAIQTAMDKVRDRSRFYRRSGTEPYKPWIILISDGEPLDDIKDIAAAVQAQEEAGKLKLFSLGVGQYDSHSLHMLSGPKVMKLKGYDFSSFFDWVNKSMRSVSMSSPDETPKGVPLPENVDKDTDSWM